MNGYNHEVALGIEALLKMKLQWKVWIFCCALRVRWTLLHSKIQLESNRS